MSEATDLQATGAGIVFDVLVEARMLKVELDQEGGLYCERFEPFYDDITVHVTFDVKH